MRRLIVLLFLLLAVLGGCSDGGSNRTVQTDEGEWTITSLGTLGGAATFVVDANEADQVVGSASNAEGGVNGFYWDSERGMMNLGTFGGQESYAVDINELGTVVGYAQDESGLNHAFVWDPVTQEKVDLGTLGGDEAIAYAINDVGQVVGFSDLDTGEEHPFIWDSETGMVDIGDENMRECVAYDINEKGQVVGRYETYDVDEFGGFVGTRFGFVWDPEEGITSIEGDAGTDVSPLQINASGQITGVVTDSSDTSMAFVYDASSGMTLIEETETTDLEGDVAAIRIDDDGQVLGTYKEGSFVWNREQGLTTIHTPEDGEFSVALDNNSTGLIVGATYREDMTSSSVLLWSEGEGAMELPDLGGPFVAASVITDAGKIYGIASPSEEVAEAVVWVKE